jgi:predicted transcriptional regulator
VIFLKSEELVDSVSGVLLRDLFQNQLLASGKPIRIDGRQWEYRLWWTEKKLLALMNYSAPMNKNRLARKAGLHYTQVVRAVGSLLEREAIEVSSKPKIWKDSRVSATYKVTPFGRFLNAYEQLMKKTEIDENVLLQTIQDLAEYWHNHAIYELAKSVQLIEDVERRRMHLLRLFVLVFEMQHELEHDRLLAVSKFLGSSFAFEDLLPYAGMLEFRWLISKAREDLVHRLDKLSLTFPSLNTHETRLVESFLEERSKKERKRSGRLLWGRGGGHGLMGTWVMRGRWINGVLEYEEKEKARP